MTIPRMPLCLIITL